jgi:hypothetical protein
VLLLSHVTAAPFNMDSVIIDLFKFIHVKHVYIILSSAVMCSNYARVLLAVFMRTELPICVLIILNFEQCLAFRFKGKIRNYKITRNYYEVRVKVALKLEFYFGKTSTHELFLK